MTQTNTKKHYHYFKNLSKLFQIPQQRIQRLESSFANVIGVFGGGMYYNMSSIYKIFYSSPFAKQLLGSFNNFVGHQDESLNDQKVPLIEKFTFVRSVIKHNWKLGREVTLFENRVQGYVFKSEQAISLDELKTIRTSIEVKWNNFNLIRSISSSVSFTLLIVSILLINK